MVEFKILKWCSRIGDSPGRLLFCSWRHWPRGMGVAMCCHMSATAASKETRIILTRKGPCLHGTCDVDLLPCGQPLCFVEIGFQHANISITAHSQKVPFCMAWRIVWSCLKLMKWCCFKGSLPAVQMDRGELCSCERHWSVLRDATDISHPNLPFNSRER